MDVKDLGKLFLVGFFGTRFTSELSDFLDELHPCGVILFGRNIEDPVQLATLNHDIQRHWLKRTGRGLFIGVDQEGGRVRRLKEPFTVFPAARDLAQRPDLSHAVREFSRITARELRLVGINLDFVPVLDVLDRSIDDAASVIGDRSFGAEADIVSRLGGIVITELRAEGVIPCAKHFPGHGGTSVDSHVGLPVDERPREMLEGSDLKPYVRAIELGVEMIMTAHVLFPALDPEVPATLSRGIVDGILRRDMGYHGLVITDDLDMAAVAKRFSPGDRSVLAFNAGADVLLYCNRPEDALSGRAAIHDAMSDGTLSGNRVRDALRRVEQLKTRYAGSLSPCAVRSVQDAYPRLT
jgi:beta-N-acetylhexosaminidase